MKKLNRFYFDQAISIDNALTTNQIIHQLIHNLNSVIEFVNNIETDAHEYTDAEISKLKIELQGEISDLNDLLDLRVGELTNLIDTKKNEAIQDANGYTDVSIENLKTDYITPIIDRIDGTLERLDLKIDYVDVSLRNLVDETKAELIDLISKGGAIYSAVTGERTNPEVVTKQLVDKVQHKNGVEWNDIITLMMSQDVFKNGYFEYADTTSGVTVRIGKEIKPLLTDSAYDPSIWWGSQTNPNSSTMVTRGLNCSIYNGYVVTSIKLNGVKVLPTNLNSKETFARYRSNNPIDNSNVPYFYGMFEIPLLNSVSGGDYVPSFYSNSYILVELNRVNILEIGTLQGDKFVIPLLLTTLNFELPTYDTIIASCTTNKKWNTWDTLTYYTTKFLSEHLATEHYNIPISNENEILYNNAPTLKNFYDNRT